MTDESENPDVTAQALRTKLDEHHVKDVRRYFRDKPTADVAEIIAAPEVNDAVTFLRLVPRTRRADVFSYLPFERQEELLEVLPDAMVTTIMNEMEADDRTRLLEELPFEIRQKILLRLSPEERRIAWQLLSYEEGSVGRLMTPEFFPVGPQQTVTEVLDRLRWNKTLDDELLSYLFVTDAKGCYVGDVSLVSLVTADPPSQKIADVMRAPEGSLSAKDEQSVAVDYFRKYDRSYIPVVDAGGVLLGIVTADDVFDVAEDEATDEIHMFGGQGALEDSYFQTPLFTLFRKRAGWLAVLFVGGTLTSATLRHYEGVAHEMAWLVFFLPLIVSSGGNTGSQAASLVIRGLAVREMHVRDWYRVLVREIVVAMGLGLVLAGMGFFRAITWNLHQNVGFVVAASLIGVVCFGAVTGAMLPFIFKKSRLDPAVISSPLLAQTVDIVGALIFYNTALRLMHHLRI